MTPINLAMSGSGLRLGAHVGGLRALLHLGANPDRLICTSGGAIIGGLFASGLSIDEVEARLMGLDLETLKSFAPWKFFSTGGLYSNKKMFKYFLGQTDGKKFKDLNIDFTCTATDLTTNDLVLLNKETFPEMTLAEAMTISSSLPFYFGYRDVRSTTHGRMMKLTDGGLIKNYPIDLFEVSDKPLVGLWVRSESKTENPKTWGTVRYLNHVLNASLDALSREHIEDAHWAKTVPIIVEGVSAVDFSLTKEQKKKIISTGFNAVINALGGTAW